MADRTFNVHRTILMARSPYFQAYFANSKAMTGSGSGSGSSSSSSSSSSDASLEVDGIKISDTEPDGERGVPIRPMCTCDDDQPPATIYHLPSTIHTTHHPPPTTQYLSSF